MGYFFLALAIVGEVVATCFLKVASGENGRWWVYLIVVGGYVAAFALLGQSMARGVPLGIAYALWAGIGVVLVALVSWFVFKEPLTLVQIVGMALVIGGVGLIELGGRH